MEIINNRYRLIELLDQNKFVSTYKAVDLLQENRLIQLKLLNSESTPASLVDFYTKRFIAIKNLIHKQITRNYQFGAVTFIDNKLQTDKIYFYTVEHDDKLLPFQDYMKKWNIDDRIDRFIELCSGIHYLHIKGFVYGHLNLKAIQVVDFGDNAFWKLKDLATIELEKHGLNGVEDTYYQAPTILSGNEPTIESDLYSLGAILLAMLKQDVLTMNPKEEIIRLKEEWSTFGPHEQLMWKKVLPIIEKLIVTESVYPYQNVQDMIGEIEESLGRKFSIIEKEVIEKLNFDTEIVGRQGEIELILKNVDRMLRYKPSKRIFFVQGDTGIGKTRFLQEMNFLLTLRKVNVFSSFMMESSGSKNLWIDILRKLISQSDTTILRKYYAELVKYFPELEEKDGPNPIDYLLEGNNKYRLLNRIAAFINECFQDKIAVFLIDDLHLADKFTLDLLSYLSTNVLNQHNLMFIVTGEILESSDNKAFLDSIALLKKRTDFAALRLNTLTKEQSTQLIQGILSLSYQPIKLTERIFSQTYGNPLFIHEVMKDLYSRKILQVSSDNGMWNVLLQTIDYDSLEVPDSIEQALINQLNDLSTEHVEVLKVVSIFNKPISINTIYKLQKQDEQVIENDLENLLLKGILQKLVSDNGYLFDYHNKVLKRIVYDAIDAEDKIQMHSLVASLLEEEKEIRMEELIFHYEGAKNRGKCIQYYLKIANQLHERHEIKAEIDYLEKAVSIIDDVIDKTNLYRKIGDLCLEVNLTDQALTAFGTALELAKESNQQENILAIFLALASLHATLFQTDQVKEYLQKVEEAFPELKEKEYRLEYNRLQAFLLGLENKPNEAEEILCNIIAESNDEFPRITGNAYLLLGFTSVQHNKIEEAIDYFLVAMNLFESTGYTKGYLGAVNNIGVIYQEYMDELDTAMKYFVKVRDLSENYGIFETEIRALSSIGNIYGNAHRFPEAYEHFKHALQKAEIGGSTWVTYHLYNLMCLASAEMGNYEKAISYYKRVVNLFEKDELSNLQTFDFHYTSMNWYQLIGNFELANEFSDKVIAFHHGRDNIYSFTAMIYKNINALRTAKDEDVKELTSKIISLVNNIPRGQFNLKALIQAAIILTRREKFNTAELIILKIEEYLTEETPDTLRARYYFLLGMKDNSPDSITYLHLGLQFARKTRHPETIAKIMMLLGDYAFQKDELYRAANFYLEGTEVVKRVVKKLPAESRRLFVNNHNFARGFVRLERIYEWLNGEQVIFEHRDIFERIVLSEEKLRQLLERDYVNSFIEHHEFMLYISEEHMKKLSENIRSTTDILLQVSGNTMKNLDMVLRYFAGVTIASRGFILSENQHEELTVLCSTDGTNEAPFNRFLFNRIRDTKEALLIDDKGTYTDVHLLPKDIHGALYIPIMQKQGAPNKHSAIIGVVYLETDLFVNNFNESGLTTCMEMMGFLAAMLEKHQLKLSATIDKLTGALTRKYLDDALLETVECSKSNGEKFSIIMFDLDRFKQINDRYGHQVGDKVLRNVSTTVMENLSENQILGRYGGEEFIIILPSVGQEQVKKYAEIIRDKIASQKLLGDKYNITVSMGIATYPEHGQQVKELIEKADQALYVAKESGRNNAVVWQKEFVNKTKPQNKLSGILTGDDIKDSRNVLAMVELIQFNNKSIKLEEKIYQFLGRIMEIAEAQIGYILLNDMNGKKYYSRKAKKEGWLQDVAVDQEILNSVLLEERGLYTINWGVKDRVNKINGLPDWDSILAVPIMVDGSVFGAIYLSTPTRMKEFGADDLNMLNVYSNILAGML